MKWHCSPRWPVAEMPFLSSTPIALEPLLAAVQSPTLGGEAIFRGVVRSTHAGREVVQLAYSAYEAMAEGECSRIVAEAEGAWPVRIALAHRVGELAVGDVAMIVVAAAGHREEAFAACRWTVDEVKRRVPIWKRETYADGSVAWVDPTAPGGTVPAEAPSHAGHDA